MQIQSVIRILSRYDKEKGPRRKFFGDHPLIFGLKKTAKQVTKEESDEIPNTIIKHYLDTYETKEGTASGRVAAALNEQLAKEQPAKEQPAKEMKDPHARTGTDVHTEPKIPTASPVLPNRNMLFVSVVNQLNLRLAKGSVNTNNPRVTDEEASSSTDSSSPNNA